MDLPYTEEVAVSIGHRSLVESGVLQEKSKARTKPWFLTRASVQQRCSNAVQAERFSHRVGGFVSHTGQHVAVGVDELTKTSLIEATGYEYHP
jgi:hypothetical protein